MDSAPEQQDTAEPQPLPASTRDGKGRFIKGVAPNPAGRPKKEYSLVQLAKTHTKSAVSLLANLIDDESAPMSSRVEAAKTMLDRGWGRAPQTLDVNVRLNFDAFLKQMGITAVEQAEDINSVIDAEWATLLNDEAESPGEQRSSITIEDDPSSAHHLDDDSPDDGSSGDSDEAIR